MSRPDETHCTALLDRLCAGAALEPEEWAEACRAGDTILPLVLARLSRVRGRSRMIALLGELEGEQVHRALAELYTGRDFRGAQAAAEALGLRGGTDAADTLRRPPPSGLTATWVEAVAGALGAEAPAVIEPILEPRWVLVESGRSAELNLLARSGAGLSALAIGAAALVRLGDLRPLPRLYSLALHGVGTAPDASALARETALIELRSVAAPGLVALLEAVIQRGGEAAELAVTTLAALGRPGDVPRLLRLQKRPKLAARVHTGLKMLIGVEPPVPVERAWWDSTWAPRLAAGSSHVAGAPSTPGPLVDAVRAGVGGAREHLREMTGVPWLQTGLGSGLLTPRELTLLDRFWPARSSDFPAGKLHRWGSSHDPSVVDGPLPELPDLRRG